MRVFVSLILTLFFYSLIVYFFFLIFNKPKPKQEVLIHTAIVLQNKTKSVINNHAKKTEIPKKKSVKKTVKTVKKVKKGSKSAFTKGGEVNFNDIFKNVKYNVDSKKLHQKKQLEMSRFKGIEKNLKKVKLINFDISYTNSGGSVSDKDIENIIAKKLSPIWDSISNIAGEYAKINIIFNGTVNVNIIESNLPDDKQNLLIEKIKDLKFDKNFNITVKFITKANK
ncbi:conserved hypothetical protein [Lebetimonas natsushimae]|uniref:Uncharacterized protein n=1 Tax=Lebetimonas natsushimae TaxID=1936991 RepID=A0A292YF13_9BACT|nr:hypothetical protein [Lebetimonas natsushimae]GAX87819.1 conserved hypothetical protein [Lebetimonas natsushimae]